MLEEIKTALSYIHTFEVAVPNGQISYRYQTDKGVISLLKPSIVTGLRFQILCIKGDLFKKTKSYNTLEEAEAAIAYLLL